MKGTIIFTARLTPAEACGQLDRSYSYREVKLSVQGDKIIYAVTRDWDYSHTGWFDDLISGVREFLRRWVDVLAFESGKSLGAEITDWVELEQGDERQDPERGKFIVGKVQSQKRLVTPVEIAELDAALNQESLMVQNPFLRLAIADYHRALNSQEDSLIYLARAIEAVERHFGGEKAMQQTLGLSKTFADFVTRRANQTYDHVRHASKTGAVTRPSPDEASECFTRTREIINKFRGHLVGSSNS